MKRRLKEKKLALKTRNPARKNTIKKEMINNEMNAY